MPKIEAFTTHRLSIPFERPLRTGNHLYVTLENVLIEVQAEGLTGIGYAFNFAPGQAEAVRLLAEDLAKTLIGKPVEDFKRHWADLWTRLNFIGHAGPPVVALAMIDTALWDLFAQSQGLPLYKLLGAMRDEVELYPTGGFLTDPIQSVIEEVQRHRTNGFNRCKIKVGRSDWAVDVARVRALREAVGDAFGIMVDVNQAWSVNTAIEAGRHLQDEGVIWYEEPVSCYDIAGTARVADALAMPVAAGESVFTRHGHLALIDGGACDTLMLNLMRTGGPTEFMRVGELAAARFLPVSSHTFTEISAHMIAAMPNGTLAEYLPGWWDNLFDEPSRIENGVLKLSNRPGVGVKFSREAIRRYGSAA
ncbi:MAG: mandelate racemase/muconate lactonizing enzyme family protein [Pseudorhodoplanes sp.]|uniref:mandelate racemase/muconate lactonizing enzyme family protein n=1 Tax=Pseudorhodoplanes sp. TaxID=1934341 RepID=UPI003D0A1717